MTARLIGLVTSNPALLLVAFAAGAVSGGGAAWTVQGWRLDAVQTQFDSFVQQTRTLGESARQIAAKTAADDKLRKEQADAENGRTLDRLRADVKRLRDARTGGGFLPAAAPGSLRPDLACFERTKFVAAIQRFDAGLSGLVEGGDEATVNLDTAKIWAQGR